MCVAWRVAEKWSPSVRVGCVDLTLTLADLSLAPGPPKSYVSYGIILGIVCVSVGGIEARLRYLTWRW